MTAKEKAIELVEDMSLATDELGYINTNVYRHKQCALIAVNEIIKSQKCCYECKYEGSIELKYWGDVKQEIQQL